MERITTPKTMWSTLGEVYDAVYRLNEIKNILGDEYDLEHLKELVEADRMDDSASLIFFDKEEQA